MTTLIILGIIIFIVYTASGKTKTPHQAKGYKNSDSSQKSVEDIRKELTKSLLSSIDVTMSNSHPLDAYNSIIDVTDQPIENIGGIVKDTSILPYYWKSKTIFSYNDIFNASTEQKEFYGVFKQAFFKNVYIELNGNTNYLHTLLFDLLREFDNGNNYNKLEMLINRLVLFYPEIKNYAQSCLSNKKESYLKFSHVNQYSYAEYDAWKLGSRYKNKLGLTEENVELLNKLWNPGNNFCSIEFCCIEILKLFISLISALKSKYVQEGTTLDSEFFAVADIIAKKHFKYRSGSQNYKYCIETTTNEFYSHIFKHCENAVRAHYGHKRKINTDTYYTSEGKTDFENKIISKVSDLIPGLVTKVASPNEATDIELYSQNTNRWKIKFEELTNSYSENPKMFVESTIALGNLNQKNPSIENIFFEASKFIATYDKESALLLYIHYLYHDLNSTSFDNKKLTKTIQKNLFKTNEQLHDFEIIISELIQEKNLEKALKAVPKIYEVKRKKIKLDTGSIKEVQQQHSGAVALLAEYLKDDYEDENNEIKAQEISSKEIKIEIIQKHEENHHSTFIDSLAFKPIHLNTLEFFAKNNLAIAQSEVETFAKSNGVFINQLINGINDICYEYLDDLLIEEEDEFYTINTNYFQKISTR